MQHDNFYFGCARSQVFQHIEKDGKEVQQAFANHPHGERAGLIILGRLQQILLQAESEGRVAWRSPFGVSSYRQLALLVDGIGQNRLSFALANIPIAPHYNRTIAKKLAEKAGLRVYGR